MPIYEYLCRYCTARFQRRLPSADAEIQRCSCCGRDLELQVSRPASFPVGKYGKAGGLK